MDEVWAPECLEEQAEAHGRRLSSPGVTLEELELTRPVEVQVDGGRALRYPEPVSSSTGRMLQWAAGK